MPKKIFFTSTIILFWLTMLSCSSLFQDWEKHVIGKQKSPVYLYVSDIDSDGDLDVASATNRHPMKWDSEVAWFRNNIDHDEPWEKFTIISSNPEENDIITNTNGIIVSDIDKDGNDDVVVVTGRVTETIGSIYWFKAPDDPTGAWKRYDIEIGAENSYFKVYTLDVNEDEMEDIIVGGRKIAVIFVNPGNPSQAGAEWEKVTILEETGGSIYLDDVNGDGKTDIINSFLHGNVSWIDLSYSNGEIIFDRKMIDDDYENAFDVNCMDVNGDLKKDVLVSTLNTPGIYWYEAPSNSGDSWIKHTLSDTYDGTDIYTGDINGDTKTDVVVSGAFIDKISWFEYKQEGGEVLWTENVIDDDIQDPGDVSLNDLDGDGDLDVVVAGLREDQMIWYENKIPGPALCPLELILGEDSPRISTLRAIRDKHLVFMPGGKWLIESYYSHSHEIVGFLRGMTNLLKFY